MPWPILKKSFKLSNCVFCHLIGYEVKPTKPLVPYMELPSEMNISLPIFYVKRLSVSVQKLSCSETPHAVYLILHSDDIKHKKLGTNKKRKTKAHLMPIFTLKFKPREHISGAQSYMVWSEGWLNLNYNLNYNKNLTEHALF